MNDFELSEFTVSDARAGHPEGRCPVPLLANLEGGVFEMGIISPAIVTL